MNNRDLILFTQCVMDSNGETEIVSLYICSKESERTIGPMLDEFKKFNDNWTKTKVIIGDKDFADRAVYQQKFPNANLQICLFHVLLAFHREITTQKRNITNAQRISALEVITRLVYSESAHAYDLAYEELRSLNLEQVSKYYDENWHAIRQEWTTHGRNTHANYMNNTNNRSERLNRTFKQISIIDMQLW